MQSAEHIVEARDLGRRFGARRALDGVTFGLRGGECLAVFGPNGAGKTTLLRVLAGLLKPTAGRASIDGVPLPGGPEVRACVGLISHQPMLYDSLTALENVEFAARLYGVDAPRDAARAALERLRVADRADTPVRALSRGLQQRVSIARAVVHRPTVILLDEPYTGLDEVGAAALTEALERLRGDGAALLLVTHRLSEGLALATHTAILRGGRFVRLESAAGVDVAAYATLYRETIGA
jgi:heme ABC exporter ATP-binding subunit CcmA